MQAHKTTRLLAVSVLVAISAVGIASADTAAPADPVAEDGYLDILPMLEVPHDVRPIPGVVNEEFRNCRAQWPAGYEIAKSGTEARAMRDIYSLVRSRNVIGTRDCGCTGKVADWDNVEAVAAALREYHGVDRLTWQQTENISVEARKLITIAETMCGGKF